MNPKRTTLNAPEPAATPSASPTRCVFDHAVNSESSGVKHHQHALIAKLLGDLAAAAATDGHAARADTFSEDLQVLPTAIFIDNAAVRFWSAVAGCPARRPRPEPSAPARPDQPHAERAGASQSKELQ